MSKPQNVHTVQSYFDEKKKKEKLNGPFEKS